MATPLEGSSSDTNLIADVRRGGPAAVRAFLLKHRPRLLRMVELRLDHRLQPEPNLPDVVVEQALLDAEEAFADYADDPKLPVFLWLRQVTAARLAATHREKLGAAQRGDISLAPPEPPMASSIALAAHLLGKFSKPVPSDARTRRLRRLEEALNGLEPLDRDILSLRHFEALSQKEAAQVLHLEGSDAAKRYIRALKRLNTALAESTSSGGG